MLRGSLRVPLKTVTFFSGQCEGPKIDAKNKPKGAAGTCCFALRYYVESSRYFAMLCPLIKHAKEGTIMGKRSYISRGWCRLELAARILSEPGAEHGVGN